MEKTLCQSEKKIERGFYLTAAWLTCNKLHKVGPERNIKPTWWSRAKTL